MNLHVGGWRLEAGGGGGLEGRKPTRQPSAFSLQPSAFSLVELVISMAILGVGLVGAMRVFPVGLRASQRAEMNSRAAIAAQRIIDSLKLKSWDELKEEETASQEDAFDVTTRIAPVTLEPLVDPGRMKTIEVRIRLTQDGRPRELLFVTFLRRETP